LNVFLQRHITEIEHSLVEAQELRETAGTGRTARIFYPMENSVAKQRSLVGKYNTAGAPPFGFTNKGYPAPGRRWAFCA